MIKVLHSLSVWLPQTEIWIYNQIRFLPPHIENHIICESMTNLDQFPIGNVHSLSDASSFRYVWDKGLRKLGIRNHLGFSVQVAGNCKPQLIHSHFGNYGWRNIELARKAGAGHIVTFYGVDASRYPAKDERWKERYKRLFERADLMLCEGPHMAGSLKLLGCPDEKVRVHRLGVPLDEISFAQRKWAPDQPLRVLIAASFREKKGIPFALDALGRIQNEIPLEITLIGDATLQSRSVQEKRKIISVIEKHGLGPKIRLLGFQTYPALMEEAYRHHIFLSPSITDSEGDTEGGAPVSLIDMAATGMIVVSSFHCDIPEIVIHGETGMLAEERDVGGIVRNIRWLAENPGEWDRMAANARARIEKEFDAATQAEKLAEIYRNVSGV